MTEYPIRGGDAVFIKMVGEHHPTNASTLWYVTGDLDSIEPCGRETDFVISAPSFELLVERFLPMLGNWHYDYANSRWDAVPIGIDTRPDQSDPYVISAGNW